MEMSWAPRRSATASAAACLPEAVCPRMKIGRTTDRDYSSLFAQLAVPLNEAPDPILAGRVGPVQRRAEPSHRRGGEPDPDLDHAPGGRHAERVIGARRH